MASRLAIKALVVWAGILVLAIANGLLREAVLIPALGKAPGLVASGLLLSALILGVTYLALPWLDVRRPAELWVMGIGWLVLTLAFEFSFGLMRGKPLAEILQAYTFSGGNIWPLVLLVTFVAPYTTAKLRDGFRVGSKRGDIR